MFQDFPGVFPCQGIAVQCPAIKGPCQGPIAADQNPAVTLHVQLPGKPHQTPLRSSTGENQPGSPVLKPPECRGCFRCDFFSAVQQRSIHIHDHKPGDGNGCLIHDSLPPWRVECAFYTVKAGQPYAPCPASATDRFAHSPFHRTVTACERNTDRQLFLQKVE